MANCTNCLRRLKYLQFLFKVRPLCKQSIRDSYARMRPLVDLN